MQKNKINHAYCAGLSIMSGLLGLGLLVTSGAAFAATAPVGAAAAVTAPDINATQVKQAKKIAPPESTKDAKDGKGESKKPIVQTVREILEEDAKEALAKHKIKRLEAEAKKREEEGKRLPVLAAIAARSGKSVAKPLPAPEPIVIPDTIRVSAVFGSSLTGKTARVSVNNVQSEVRAGESLGAYRVAEVGNGCVVLTAASAAKNLAAGRHCFTEQQAAVASVGSAQPVGFPTGTPSRSGPLMPLPSPIPAPSFR
jgi:hypothetical protein